MSDMEMLLSAWLTDGTVPEGFTPSSDFEKYLLAIVNGVDDDLTPKNRADVLLDAIATKYAGFADGIDDLQDVTGVTSHHVPGADTPEAIAAYVRLLNTLALQDLASKGATGVSDNTTDILDAYSTLPSGGTELNIGYGNTAPEDTTALWVKTPQPQNVTVDYDINNGVESVALSSTPLAAATGESSGAAVGTKIYLFGGKNINNTAINTIRIFDTDTETLTVSPITLPTAAAEIGCCAVGTKIYLFGGYASGSSYYNAIRVYDTETNTLTTINTTLPNAVRGFGCASVGTKCYMFGGSLGSDYSDAIVVFDAETREVSTLPVTLPKKMAKMGCVAVGTKIYLFGGAGANMYDYIQVFDTETNTLTTLAATMPQIGDSTSCVANGSKCYVLCGSIFNGVSNAINVFDTETNTLTTLAATMPKSVAAYAARGIVGCKAFVFGGWNGSANDTAIQKFTVTFPLNEGDVYIQTDVFKNKFDLVKSPTEVKTGVSAVYVGNANDEAEYCEALLYDGTEWQQIT